MHQSPDYYQLKVSVFNDDKKTDLIGETWVDLKGVITQGGGQSDSWHSLNCKGKYAGEIRIELTYYDTRPKDEAVVERRKETPKVEGKSHTNSSLSGPRQAKPPKRRPLPADPTGASPARPSSTEVTKPSKREKESSRGNPTRPAGPEPVQSVPQPNVPRTYETPDDFHQQWAPQESYPADQGSTMVRQTYPTPEHTYRSETQGYQGTLEQSYPPRTEPSPTRQGYYHESNIPQQSAPSRQAYHIDPQGSQGPSHPPSSLHQLQIAPNERRSGATNSGVESYNHRSMEPYNPHHGAMPIQSENPYQVSTDYRYEPQHAPAERDAYGEYGNHPQVPEPGQSYSQNSFEATQRHNTHYATTPEHRQNSYPPVSIGSSRGMVDYQAPSTPERNQPFPLVPTDHQASQHQYSTPVRNDGYRDSPLRQSVVQAGYYQQNPYVPPQVDDEDEDGPPPPPPAHRNGLGSQQPAEPFMSEPQHVSVPEPLNVTPRTSPNPIEKQSEYIPYSPNYATSSYVSERSQVYSTSPAPSYRSVAPRGSFIQERPTTSGSDSVPTSLVAGIDPAYAKEPERAILDYRYSHRQSEVPVQPPAPAQVVRFSANDLPERRSPRAVVDPRQVPCRKSVSPHPPPPADSDSLSGIPFSPDSYDAINPVASHASAVEQPLPPYESVERAMEVARQQEVDKMRAVGPIIGNDGRTIDPSDHLPADTWAPEPVRKNKKPEVVVRFKHAPASTNGSRPSTADRERQPRPRSVVASNVTYHSAPQTHSTQSYSSTRSRVPKTTSARPQSYVQPSVRDPSPRPPRERDSVSPYSPYSTSPSNVNTPPHYGGSAPPPYTHPSPTPASRYSPAAVPSSYHSSNPPIPAKVPIQPPVQTYSGGGEIDALSEEMRRIDIGMGRGARTRGRITYPGGHGQ